LAPVAMAVGPSPSVPGTMVEADAQQAAELNADIKELKTMMASATRPNVKKELSRVLDMLEAEARRTGAKTQQAAVSEPSAPPASAAAAAPAVAKKAPEPEHKPVPIQVVAVGPWTEITTFALDLGGYDKEEVVVDIRMKGVEALKSEAVTCDFTESSFDLKVVGFEGKNHRMLKTNLDKDIVPAESSVRVKKNHVIVTLKKVKGKYGFDSWSDLCAKGKRKPTSDSKKKEDPSSDIMGMMQNLYEDGDDNMKKIIGEAMYKAHRGEKYEPKTDQFGMKDDPAMPDLDDI